MTLRIEPFQGATTEWDSFVRGSNGWTHFHLYGWRTVMERVFGHECVYLAARDQEGQLAGVLPLVRVRSLLFGHYLVSMPYLNYGGPVGTPEAVSGLARRAVDQAQTNRVKLLELRSRVPLELDLPVSHRKITVILDLPAGDAAPLWDGLKAKVRSQVRRPMKEGVEVRFGAEQLDPFFEVFAHHMRDLGTPTQGRRFFRVMHEVFGDAMWLGVAWHQGRPVAGGCGFRWGDEFEMTWASSLVAYNRMAPNMLVYWSFMERCVQQGMRVFNFGRCTPEGGTHRFKRQWGSRDEPLSWYQWSASGAAATPSPDAGPYRLGPRLWRHLPRGIATALGPRIVRGIP